MIQLLSKTTALLVLPMLIVVISCSSGEMEFQNNNPDPDYYLFGLLEDYPALEDSFHDVDQHTFNTLMADGVNVDLDCTVDILPITPDVIDPLTALLGDTRSILGRVIYQDQGDHPDDPYNYYAKDFYAFSDDLASFSAGSAEDITEILRKSMGYIEYAHVDDVEDVMGDLSIMLRNPDMASLLDVLQEAGGKLFLQANSSMQYQDNDLDLGNATRGMDALLSGLRDISSNDAAARQRLFDIIREMNDLFAVKVGPGNKKFNDILRDLMINIEDYATIGGSQYSSNPAYSQDNSGIYVNTELRNGIREMWPSLVSLFIKAKGEWESEDMPDWSVIHDPENGESVMEYLSRQLYMLKNNCNIDIGDSNNPYGGGELERSLRRMVTYNAYGEKRDEAAYTVSYLDHMLYTLASSYDFGFKTRFNADGEPYRNDADGHGSPRCHGESTNGIITVNDSLYSMTSHAKHAKVEVVFTILDEWFNVYGLCLDNRLTQGNNVFRSSDPFNSSQANSHKYYMGYDFPTLALLSGFSAGDAGIPNGGETAIVPTSAETGEEGSNNDYRTFFTRVGNGLGELNTGRWVMGWIARACWEGEGPYYYAPEEDGGSSDTTMFDVNNDGSAEPCNIYYRPDGRVYAYVHKAEQGKWEYYYPAEGNDPVDADGQRENRYREVWQTDKYLIKSNYTNNSGSTRYYAPDSVVGTSGQDKYLLHKINDAEDTGDDLDAATNQAGSFTFHEKIDEQSAVRQCASQEEAMFRNFQWLMLEKKIVFVMPMRSFVDLEVCGKEVRIDSPVYTVIESNGIVGVSNTRKGNGNGHWVIKGNEGTDIDHDSDPNNVNYGDSYEPGDGRVFVLVKEDAAYASTLGIVRGDSVTLSTIWDTILGDGHVLPDAVGRNIAPIARMAFLESQYIESHSPEIGNVSSDIWYNRNKILPLVVALAGNLHQKSYYDSPESGHNYNYVGNHKYPLKILRDLIHMLGQPLIRHHDDNGGRWMPVVNNQNGHGKYAAFAPRGYGVDYRPNDQIRSVVSVLTENGTNVEAACDGLVPALAETNMVTKLMAFLQTTGDTSGVYADVNKTSDDYTQWGARRKVFYGLEQVFTTIKCSEGIATSRGYFDVFHPEWMYTMRDVDVNMDGLLDELIGYSSPDPNNDLHGKGLAVFVDNRSDSDPNRNWDNYYMLTEGIGELLSKKGSTSGEYCITDNLVNVLDSTLSSFDATDAQLKGVRHTLGSVFTEYDDAQGKWVYPQDLKNILMVHLPDILDAYQGHHQNLVYFANTMLMKDGFVEYLLKTLDSRYPAEDVYTQLHAFLGNELVCKPDSPLWCDLNELLISFVDMMVQQNGLKVASTSLFEETVYMPEVTPTAKYDSYNIDPYTALGEILSK